MLNLPETIAIVFLAILTIGFAILYLREYNLRKNSSIEGDKILEQFKNKSFNLLHDSIKKSQAILGSAELEGIKAVADTKFTTNKMEADYSHTLSDLIMRADRVITGSQAELIKFMADLQTRGKEFEASSQQATQERINQLFEKLETRLADFLVSTEQKTTSSIELELRGARELIEGYKQQQLALIDENIIAMMEQTLSIVLTKKLSLKDQLDLIYEALEKAKVEKFIV